MTRTAVKRRKKGRRVATGYEEKRRSYKEYGKAQDTRPQKNAENKAAVSAKKDRRRLWQMTVSAMILIGVIALKLLAPQSVSRYRETLLDLIGHIRILWRYFRKSAERQTLTEESKRC